MLKKSAEGVFDDIIKILKFHYLNEMRPQQRALALVAKKLRR